ncbi:hypothetical protein ACWEPN_39205 [Nonomuraea wenchangensis]
MPKLKSLITGLAVSTAMTGAAVAMAPTAANATPVTSLVSVATGDWDDDDSLGDGLGDGLGTGLGNNWGGGWNNWGGGWGGGRHQRCHRGGGGGGWGGWGRRHGRICVVVRNHNRNINDDFEHDRRRRHLRNFDNHNFENEVS